MEKFKKDIYTKETGNLFPQVEILDGTDKIEILRSIYTLIRSNEEDLNLFLGIEKTLLSKDFNEEYTYDAYSIFKDFNFDIEENVFIIWSEDEIDEIQAKFTIDNWNYIWYGNSDEAVILYQENKKKLVLITHYGRVFYQ